MLCSVDAFAVAEDPHPYRAGFSCGTEKLRSIHDRGRAHQRPFMGSTVGIFFWLGHGSRGGRRRHREQRRQSDGLANGSLSASRCH